MRFSFRKCGIFSVNVECQKRLKVLKIQEKPAISMDCRFLLFGDPYGNRTHITAVKGRCLNLLTNGPGSGNLTRTDDTPGMNRMLYQLSYAAIYCCVSQQEILYRQRCDLSTTFVRFFRGFRKFFLPRQPIRPKRRPGRGPRRAHGGADYADFRPRRRP